VQLSGASASASDAAITQLIQGLQSGVLRGEEFNSVMEQAPRLAQALAAGLGVTTGQLRAMAQAGELTAKTVITSLQSQSAALQDEFTSFARTDGKPAAEPTATAINVGFSSPLYATSYAYDSTSNTYARSLAGTPHADREKGQITPSVVVVIKVGTQSRGGPDGY
jgi:tape measure domain-containing protein